MKRSTIDETAVMASRFWPRVTIGQPEECWPYSGATDPDGYGFVSVNMGSPLRAHRVAYQLTHGSVPDDLVICHACDNPPCCNPLHLWAGTVQENNADRDRKGRTHTDGPIPKLTPNAAAAIRTMYATGNYSQRDLAIRFGVHQMTVSRLVRGKTKAYA